MTIFARILGALALATLLAGCSTDYRDLESADMCDLLKPAEVTELLADAGPVEAKAEQRDLPYCGFAAEHVMTFSVSLYEQSTPIEPGTVVGGDIKRIELAGQEAFEQQLDGSTCSVFVPLEDGLYLNTSVDGHDGACDIARRATEKALGRLDE